eukprot:jgi/Mesvir1/26956/Mv20675-RA.1
MSEGPQGKSHTAQTRVIPNIPDKPIPSAPAAENAWVTFSGNATGEWDGYTANFNSKGQPLELPYSVVPSAFRDWDIKLFDWRTQCLMRPVSLGGDAGVSIQCEMRYLNPTVGCEADAATLHKSMSSNLPGEGASDGQSLLASHPSGSYCCLPRSLPPAWLPNVAHAPDASTSTAPSSSSSSLTVETCLVEDSGLRTRVRFAVMSADAGREVGGDENGPHYCVGARWKLSTVTVSREEKVGQQADAATLPGCGSQRRANEFAASAPVSLDLVNRWSTAPEGKVPNASVPKPFASFRAPSAQHHGAASQWTLAGGHLAVGPPGSALGAPGQVSPPRSSSGAPPAELGFGGFVYGANAEVVGKNGTRQPFLGGSYVALPGGMVVGVSSGSTGELNIESVCMTGEGRRMAWRCSYGSGERGGLLQTMELAAE